MEPSRVLLQAALIFLPGIVWAKIDESYASRKELKQSQLLVKSFLFGIASYSLLFLIYRYFGKPFAFFDEFEKDEALPITDAVVWQIVWAVAIAFLASIFWVYIATYNLIERGLLFISAISDFTPVDSDVWNILLNSNSPATRYLQLRDFQKELIYTGYLQRYSDKKNLRELYLSDVVLYDFEGNELVKIPNLYLARKPDDIHLEFPYDSIQG